MARGAPVNEKGEPVYAAGAGLEPHERVVARSESLRWTVPEGSDSLNVQLLTQEGDTVFQQSAMAGDSVTARLTPGRYRFRARAYLETRLAGVTEGPVEVEEFSEVAAFAPESGS